MLETESGTEQEDSILTVSDLSVAFEVSGRIAEAVGGIDFSISRGKTLGLVGESGSGKSVTSLAIMQLLDNRIARIGGSVKINKRELLGLSERKMQAVRGNEIAMIFQEPMTSLNPVYTIGNQIVEALLAHVACGYEAATTEAIKVLDAVGIADAANMLRRYPHELSGGMKQRVMIAMALICKPKLLIADEPTTALDVTVQAQILDLLRSLQQEYGMSILFITHDLGVIAEIAHEVCVMYAGKIVEKAEVNALFAQPQHPYTSALVKSVPQLSGERKRLYSIKGSVPSIFEHPVGCNFQDRCAYTFERCQLSEPELCSQNSEHHFVACWRSTVD